MDKEEEEENEEEQEKVKREEEEEEISPPPKFNSWIRQCAHAKALGSIDTCRGREIFWLDASAS